MRGILLAGGSGTRLHPVTLAVSKHLIPLHDKPMVYYPLSVLMQAGVSEILVITTPRDLEAYRRLLGDGSALGLQLAYATQDEPRGIADALRVGRSFLGSERVALILGDNVFHGHGLTDTLERATSRPQGATVFAYRVTDPERYGVVELDAHGHPLRIVEKPDRPISPLAITGLYFYDARAVEIAAELEPSSRGELEISEVNAAYLAQGALTVEVLGRGIAWLDTGTFPSLMKASAFIQALEERQGLKVGCLEEIAYEKRFIDLEHFTRLAREHPDSEYGRYLQRRVREESR
jgi:glucose-1-phosphate thymidylyltransferase